MLPASRRGCQGWWGWWAGVVGRRAAVRVYVRPRRPLPAQGVYTYSAARSTVHTLAQMGPPILKVAAARGFGACKPAGALPSSWSALQPIMAMPVAPMGCPLAISPPDVLMAHSPSGAALPSTQYW